MEISGSRNDLVGLSCQHEGEHSNQEHGRLNNLRGIFRRTLFVLTGPEEMRGIHVHGHLWQTLEQCCYLWECRTLFDWLQDPSLFQISSICNSRQVTRTEATWACTQAHINIFHVAYSEGPQRGSADIWSKLQSPWQQWRLLCRWVFPSAFPQSFAPYCVLPVWPMTCPGGISAGEVTALLLPF